jgi:tetratricopeptide (TPR) repeat protein
MSRKPRRPRPPETRPAETRPAPRPAAAPPPAPAPTREPSTREPSTREPSTRERWGWLALAAVGLLALALAFREITESDLGFHLRAGEWILANGRVPATDPFTYTVSDHPYIDLHWLYQIALVALYRAGGPLAVVAVHAALAVAAFALVALTARARARSPLALAVPLLLAVLASEIRFTPRPELVSWLLLGATLLILGRRAAGRPAPLWALPLITLIWVNVEGLFVLAWVAIGATLLGTAIDQRRWDRPLAAWGAAAVLVTLLNPYGLSGVFFPLTLATRLSGTNVFGQTIGEFMSPWNPALFGGAPFYPRLAVWAYYILVALAALTVALAWRRQRSGEVLIAAALFVLSIQAIRNVPLFALGVLPPLAAGLETLPARLAGLGRPRGRVTGRVARRDWPAVAAPAGALLLALVALGLTARVVTNAYYIDDRRDRRLGYALNASVLPVRATEFLREAGVEGRLFNHLADGGYLMWQLRRPVFIDGRLEVMGEEFYAEYLTASRANGLLALLERYDAQVAVFPYSGSPSWLDQLRAAPRWRMVYVDAQSAVYLRDDVGPDLPAVAFPAQTPGGLAIPLDDATREALLYAPREPGWQTWLSGFWQPQTFPDEPFHIGLLHFYLNRPEAAEAYLLEALRDSRGRYYEIYNNLGAVYYRLERTREAIYCYEIVVAEQPGNSLARERLRDLESR